MKSVFQAFLNLLLAVSLSAAPVTAALAAGSLSSYAAGQDQGSAGLDEMPPASVPCSAVVDDCSCPDTTGCLHVTATTPLALPAGLLEFAVTVSELLITGFQDSHSRLNLPPDSPPPIA